MRVPVSALVLITLLILSVSVAAALTDSPRAASLLITQPSANESCFAEMRDFYVYGIFPARVERPGDIRIELFRGEGTNGERVRLIESRVDPVTGITPWSAIEQNYPNGTDWGNKMVPDLVKDPGGLSAPSNKLVVTNDYYLGLVLGGVTKNFDTTYRDRDGKPLTDLTAGTYTIRVTGLSGDLAGQSATETLTFGTTSTALSTDRPAANLANRFSWAWSHNLRVYRDWFPGYYLFERYGNKGYTVPGRWNPNNGIEIVNDLPGTLIDKPPIANNTMIQYNINDKSTTWAVEIAAIVRYGLEDSPNTTFLYYDTGEPYLPYRDEGTGSLVNLTGALVPFGSGERLVLTRAEIYRNATSSENLYDPNDITTPHRVDTRPAEGITVYPGETFRIFGVTKPIRTTVTATGTPYRFMLDNRISQVTYTITDSRGPVFAATREVNLSRLYTAGSPQRFNSLFEFGNEFTAPQDPGRYQFSLHGVDQRGNEVPGTRQEFAITVAPLPFERIRNAGDSRAWIWSRARACFPAVSALLSPISYGDTGAAGVPGTGSVKKIAIISIPDIHSAIIPHPDRNGSVAGGLARSAEVVRSVRSQYDGTLLLSSGDDMGNDESGIFFRLFHGVPERRAMSAVGFDAGTIGNHDFDEGVNSWADSLGATSFPMVSANVRFANRTLQDRIVPFIVRDVAGVRIGIFGLSIPDPDEYVPGLDGIAIDGNLTGIAREMVRELREKERADLVIALTHLGKERDRELAKTVDGIDLIIGGHDHIWYGETAISPSGKPVIMTDAGVYGDAIGVLSFRYTGTGIGDPVWTAVSVDGSRGTDSTVAAILDPYVREYTSWSDAVAGELEEPLDARVFDPGSGEYGAARIVTDAMRQYGEGSDIALLPVGSLNRSAVYPEGNITRGEIGLLVAHNNRLSFIRMPGRDIVQALETGASFLRPVERNGTATLASVSPLDLQSSGISVQVNLSAPPNHRISGVKVLNGTRYEPINLAREYRVVVNTRIGQFAEGYEMFQDEPAEDVNNTDVRILDTVLEYMARAGSGNTSGSVPARSV